MATQYTNAEKEIGIDITYEYLEVVQGFPHSKTDDSYHNHFRITLTTEAGRIAQDYYGSAHDYEHGKKTLTDDDLKGALRCIVDDALYGQMDFEEFCGELGYDEDSRNAEKIHKACIKTSEELQSIGIGGDDLYTIVNDLSEF